MSNARLRFEYIPADMSVYVWDVGEKRTTDRRVHIREAIQKITTRRGPNEYAYCHDITVL